MTTQQSINVQKRAGIHNGAHFQIFYLDILDGYHSANMLLWSLLWHPTLWGGEFNTSMIISIAMPIRKLADTGP